MRKNSLRQNRFKMFFLSQWGGGKKRVANLKSAAGGDYSVSTRGLPGQHAGLADPGGRTSVSCSHKPSVPRQLPQCSGQRQARQFVEYLLPIFFALFFQEAREN